MFVRRAIDHYLKGKRSRRDVTRFLETHPDLDRLAERIADEIREGRYRDTRITYFNRVEPISGKHRVIGRESVRHQIYDHVAVMALQPLFDAKVGRWQTASIPNRGTIDARRAIKRWTRERSSKWFVKLDVRKYYPSIDRPTLKAMLTRDVGDPILLRLVFHLIDRYQGDNGLNIGSYLSQWLANYYLSHAYHWIESPAMTIERTSRRTGEITRRRLITHQLWYMDDLLLIGTSKRDLKIAARRIVRYLKDALKLDVHEEWNCKRLDLEPIDMVGYTFRPHGRVNIRSGVFLRARRTFNRARRRPMTEQLARRCCSYYGYLRNSDSIRYRRRHRIDHTMRRATRYLSTQHRKENPCSRPYPASNPRRGQLLPARRRPRGHPHPPQHHHRHARGRRNRMDGIHRRRSLHDPRPDRTGSHRTGRQHLARLRAGIQIGQSAPRRLGGVQPRSGRGIGRNLPAAVRG
ncbi:MAG: RNA-directed DNA polymerase [Bifidobacterium adolescentis]